MNIVRSYGDEGDIQDVIQYSICCFFRIVFSRFKECLR
jgi:hypothetical protein